ncbi:zincin-like metallopeptidase domain-containing protein [Chryseobacterium scophthalmum]|uniref:zincin-like metallopeptidase domain-containing protein n=1 Tax=Chryseobacterium scophthalmum TaxID=59733 RepID=UPI001AEBC387|nr:zincin-like metallopeptidase domain-containing protein [Chryseobacterium scophthalmum]
MQNITENKKASTGKKEGKPDLFIERILDNLDKVNAKDWEMYSDLSAVYPSNLFTGTRYQGYNVLALYLDTMVKKFSSARYATFNSIAKAGGRLKKGSKGCLIEFFTYVFKDKESGKLISAEVVEKMNDDEKRNVVKIPCARNYVVFNSEQIENLEEITISMEIEDHEKPEILETENCEKFVYRVIKNGNLNLRFSINEIAFYSPGSDFVMLPKKQYFISASKYYSTLFHEILHWTGHEKRLNRNLKGHDDKASYSFEELIAEMGSMLLCLQFGISEEFLNSVRYLKSWSGSNREDRAAKIRSAFVESKRGKKFLENLQ